jgi:hypothetical protein
MKQEIFPMLFTETDLLKAFNFSLQTGNGIRKIARSLQQILRLKPCFWSVFKENVFDGC